MKVKIQAVKSKFSAAFAAASVLLSLFGFAPRVPAQSYSIDWFTIDGGGGTSTGGVYSVSGTIGQPDAGALSSGGYALSGGFWAGLGTERHTVYLPLAVRRY